MNRGVWWATVHGAAQESDVTDRLNNSMLTVIKVTPSLED